MHDGYIDRGIAHIARDGKDAKCFFEFGKCRHEYPWD